MPLNLVPLNLMFGESCFVLMLDIWATLSSLQAPATTRYPRTMPTAVEMDLRSIRQLFTSILEHNAQLSNEIRRYVLTVATSTYPVSELSISRFKEKHQLADSSEWLDGITDAIVAASVAMRGRLSEELSRQSAKLADVMPLAVVDDRLSAIHSYAIAKGEAVADVSKIVHCLADDAEQQPDIESLRLTITA